jgi:hypothetical protein
LAIIIKVYINVTLAGLEHNVQSLYTSIVLDTTDRR